MLFISLSRVVAWLAIFFAVFHLAIGLGVAFGYLDDIALRRYAPGKSSGALIDRGIYTLLVGIGFGALAAIGRAVVKKPPVASSAVD